MVVWTSFISYRTNQLFNSAFQRLGEAMYKRPWLFIIIGLVLTALAGSGVVLIEMESQVINLWVPQSSAIYADYKLQESVFGSSPANLVLLFKGPNHENIFTPNALTQASNARAAISDITIQYNDHSYTFHDLCARIDITSTECIADHMNIHSVFFANTEAIWSDPQYIDNALNNDQISYFAGNLHHDGDTVTGANVIRVVYELTATSDEELTDILDEYEKAFIAYWKQHSTDYSEFDVLIYTSNAFGAELQRTVVQDSIMFVIAFGVMLFYLQLTLGGFTCIRARPLLATSSIFVLLCALIFGFGISGYLGMKFSTLVFVVPFLLLGVGVDDMIIIIDTLNHTKLRYDNEAARAKQVGLALQHSGVSISLTSFCSIVAFFAGSITDLPGLQYFCMYAAFSFLGNYLLQFLLFVPLLVYDNTRIRANRNFCCPCFVHESVENEPDEIAPDDDDDTLAPFCSLNGILERSLIKLLSGAPGRVCVIIFFIILTLLSGYFATKVKATSDATMLVPDDSFVKEFYSVNEEAWPGVQPKEIQMVLVDIDFANSTSRKQVYALMDKVENLTAVVGEVENWLEPFTEYVTDTKGVDIDSIDDAFTFYSYLKDFEEASDFNHWADELVFDDEDNPTQIVATRFYFNALETADGMKQYDSYLFYNKLMDEMMGSNTKSFMMQGEWIYRYFDYALKGYTLNNLLVSLGAVLVILIFLMDIRLAVFIMMVILCIDVCLFGWMYAVGIDLQVISFCQLCMAVGLTVDYVIHMVHAIAEMKLKGNNNGYEARIRLAMLETGGSVIKGAVTTFVGAAVLAFAGSVAFRSFFYMLAGIIVVASLFGLVLAPALMGQLSFIYSGLDAIHAQMERENQILEYQQVSVVSATENSHDDSIL